ncbi:hypothetical protein UY286_21605 [Paenibacillus polymyxa]|uniref:hypothetical protein n=1 Tax=Paenibacillus polymyxa TaxID=1406 RepID=UPI002AB37494|nr:hypothetical protein [Paenibacillus polymyxa]MDY8120036.1 hypothetical protein [Paenibacillus polymyxa]
MENNFCLEVINNPDVVRNEYDKQRFKAALKELHNNGYYLVGVKGSNKVKTSNKNPNNLEAQRRNLEHIVNSTFQRMN